MVNPVLYVDNSADLSIAYGERQTSSDAAIAQNRDKLKYIEELQTQLREHRSLLRHALLGADSLLKQSEELRRSNEYKIVYQQLEAVRSASADDSLKITEDTALSLTDKIETGRVAISERDKVRHSECFPMPSRCRRLFVAGVVIIGLLPIPRDAG